MKTDEEIIEKIKDIIWLDEFEAQVFTLAQFLPEGEGAPFIAHMGIKRKVNFGISKDKETILSCIKEINIILTHAIMDGDFKVIGYCSGALISYLWMLGDK